MSTKKNDIKDEIKAEVVEMFYKIDPSIKDPLEKDNFEEIEVEEFNYYYNVHLGKPTHKKDE